MNRGAEKRLATVAGEWFGGVPLLIMLSIVHVVGGSIAVRPLSTELPWTGHRFHIDRLFGESAIRRPLVHLQESMQ